MQVSTVCANRFLTLKLNNVSSPDNNTNITDEAALKTFASAVRKTETYAEMEHICEWKTFCQNRILAGDLDYLA